MEILRAILISLSLFFLAGIGFFIWEKTDKWIESLGWDDKQDDGHENKD